MALFRMYWQRLFRKPGSVILWMALPFVFMAIYSLVFGSGDGGMPKVGIALMDQDGSMASGFVKASLADGAVADMIRLVDARDTTEVEALFKEESASAAIVIPEGFGAKMLRAEADTLRLLRNPRHTIGPQVAEGIVRSLVAIANGIGEQFGTPGSAQGLSVIQKIDVVVVDENAKEEENFSMAALFFPGLIMFGLLSLSLHVEHRFMMDRIGHVTDRIVTAPVAAWRVAVEQRLFAVSFLYLMGAVSLLLGAIVWRMPATGLITANWILVALALFIAGWNGSLFALSKSVRAASAIASTAMVFVSILGGGFFPAEFMPAGFQSIVKWMPTGMANLGFTRALTGRELTISFPLLFAMSLAFFSVSVVLGRKRIR